MRRRAFPWYSFLKKEEGEIRKELVDIIEKAVGEKRGEM